MTHLWDTERQVGQWFAAQLDPQAGSGAVLWDAYLFYGPEATWQEEPGPLLGSGATIYSERETLRTLLQPFLNGAGGR